MKTLTGKYIYSMDKSYEPALRVDPGETIRIETMDAFGGQIKSEKDTLEDLDMAKVNPATGPIYLNSAAPGDTLVVKIKTIKVKSPGVQGIVPGFGFLSDQYSEPLVTVHEITEGKIEFENLNLPVEPMIGTIGVAPEGEAVPCNTPGNHGGNLDTPAIGPGSTLHLPVFHEGALFSLGDAHALQADGEVCGVAIEVATETELELDVLHKQITTPIVETNEKFITLGSAEHLEQAGKIALNAMITHLEKETKFTSEQAYKFCSIAVNMNISQVVNPLKTVGVSVNKSFL